MTNPILYPPLIDELGQPANPRSDDYIESHEIGRSNAWGTTALPPMGWNGGGPDSSRQVGWTLHARGKSRIVEEHAFSINPQAITRTDSTRNQLFATQGGFYVDDFGPGPITIQLTQLVAHGRASAKAGGALARASMREDVIRFYDLIYTKAVANPGQYDVYFHDNHLWDKVTARSPERVYFPPQAFQLVRSVQLHNVWQLQLSMTTLDAPPAAAKSLPQTPGQPQIKVYVVRSGDTLKKIATRLAGKHASHQRVLAIERQIIALSKKYGQDDITKTREVDVFLPSNTQTWVGRRSAKRMQLVAGEKIVLPAG